MEEERAKVVEKKEDDDGLDTGFIIGVCVVLPLALIICAFVFIKTKCFKEPLCSKGKPIEDLKEKPAKDDIS